MFRPCFVVKKSERQSISDALPFLFPHFKKELKRFVCFVAAENKEIMVVGSGTLTTNGLVTAAHLFAFSFDEVTVTLFVDDCHIATVPVSQITLDYKRDIAFADIVVPSYTKPCFLLKSGTTIKGVSSKLIAFGCPEGVLGNSWKPILVGHSKDYIITRGVAIPGISGGGIYFKDGDEWYILAVHSFAYQDSKTLYSRRIP